MQKYLNLGCGAYFHRDWVNIDFKSNDDEVIEHNLLNGIPFDDCCFEVVYHSHVLEHFNKPDGRNFIKDCHRVLKEGGLIRVVVPDLEQIAKNYLSLLEESYHDLSNPILRANYEWMLLELYDQVVRSKPGGQMIEYLSQDALINEDFIFSRIGAEGKEILENIRNQENSLNKYTKPPYFLRLLRFLKKTKNRIPLVFLSKQNRMYYEIGKFRMGGEIHQWMYDRFSLTRVLQDVGFSDITIVDAFVSKIPNWDKYNLDIKNSEIRKPDSIFIEAIKIN